MTPSLLAIAVNAHIEQNETHIPEIVHSRKNLAKDVFISLNLLSSPAFFILKNKFYCFSVFTRADNFPFDIEEIIKTNVFKKLFI